MNRPGQPTPNMLYVMTPLGAMSPSRSAVAPVPQSVVPSTGDPVVTDAPAVAESVPPMHASPAYVSIFESVPPAPAHDDNMVPQEPVVEGLVPNLPEPFPFEEYFPLPQHAEEEYFPLPQHAVEVEEPAFLEVEEPALSEEEPAFQDAISTVPLPMLSIVPDSVEPAPAQPVISEAAGGDSAQDVVMEAQAAPPPVTSRTPSAGSPHLARLRCALACAHAARRVYEFRRPGDDRLRPGLALVCEVATGGRRTAGEAVMISRLVVAIEVLRQARASADVTTESAIAAVMDAAEAAIMVSKREPWRTVDMYARRAYLRAAEAVRTGRAAASAGGNEQALAAALAGQDELAFGQATLLWSATAADPASQESQPAVTPAGPLHRAVKPLRQAPRSYTQRAASAR